MTESVIQHKYSNLPEMIINVKNIFYKKPAIRWIQKIDNRIQAISYSELADSMKAIFYGLKELGFEKGDFMGIYSKSTPEWIMADFGIQALGAVCVPIDPNSKPTEAVSILKDSNCRLLFVDSYEKAREINSLRDNIPNLKLLVVCSPKKTLTKVTSVIPFQKLLSIGEQQYHSSNRFNRSVINLNSEDGAYLHYNLDSIEKIEGVLVSHKDLLSDAQKTIQLLKEQTNMLNLWKHHYFSVMSLSHPFSRVFVVASFLIGASIDITTESNLKSLELPSKN